MSFGYLSFEELLSLQIESAAKSDGNSYYTQLIASLTVVVAVAVMYICKEENLSNSIVHNVDIWIKPAFKKMFTDVTKRHLRF